jgi:ELWxxDGT repeat protein
MKNLIITFFSFVSLTCFGQVTKITNFTSSVPFGTNNTNTATAVGDLYFFSANEGSEGNELWVTDGTSQGTKRVKAIRPGQPSTDLHSFTAFKDNLYFFADDGVNGKELWKSDGTTEGTIMVSDIAPGSASSVFVSSNRIFVIGNFMYFQAWNSTTGSEFYISDGTSAGTKLIKDIYVNGNSNPHRPFLFKNKIYFFAESDVFAGSELWTTDGTSAGTTKVKLLNEGGRTNICTAVVTNNEKLYFTMQSGFNDHLYVSDGTAGGTIFVKNLNTSVNQMEILQNNNAVFTVSTGNNMEDIWVTNGTADGTIILKDLDPFIKRPVYSLIKWEDHAYILANDADNLRLFKSDGTISGTTIIKNFSSDGVTGIQYLASFSKEFIIVAYPDFIEHIEIFVSKGTPETTKILTNLNPTFSESSKPADFRELENGNIIFKAEETANNRELFYYNRLEPMTISLQTDKSPSCSDSNDGEVSVIISNGIPPFTFIWSTGATTQTVSDLPKGTHSVTVTDKNNQVQTKTVTLTAPLAINVNENIRNETGNTANGRVILNVTGGTQPYTFLWSTGATTQNITNLSAGNYSVTITDKNGCTFTETFIIERLSSASDINNCYHVVKTVVQDVLHLKSCNNDVKYVSLLSSEGRLIDQYKFTNEIIIPTDQICSGLYIIQIFSETDKSTHNARIIKI